MARANQQRQSDFDQSEVELGKLLTVLRHQIRLKLDIHLPATVIAYDSATEKAQVQIGWLEILRDLQSPLPNAEVPAPPKVITCRVAWMDNGIGDGSRFPIPPGTTGTVSVYDRDLGTWLLSPPGTPVDPMFSWNHMLKDSTFSPDIRPDTVQITPVTNQLAHVVSASAKLILGGETPGLVEPVVKAGLLETFLAAAATAASAAAVPNDGGAVAFTTFANIISGGVPPGLAASAGSLKTETE